MNTYYKILDFYLTKLKTDYNVVVLDNNEKIPSHFFSSANRFTSSSEVGDVLSTIVTDLKERIAKPQDSYQKWMVIIPDLASTAMSAALSEGDLKLLLVDGAKHGVLPVFVGHYQDLVNNTYDNYIKLILQLVDQVFLGVRISDQNHTRYPYLMNEPNLKPTQGYILYPEEYEFVQLMEI